MKKLSLLGVLACVIATVTAVGKTAAQEGAIDLTATLLGVNTNQGFGSRSASTVAGAAVSVEYRINNLGSEPSSAGSVGFYISKTPAFTTSSVLLTYASLFETVPASGSTPNEITIVALPPTLAVGTHYIIVVANYDHSVGESNPENNASNALPIIVTATTR